MRVCLHFCFKLHSVISFLCVSSYIFQTVMNIISISEEKKCSSELNGLCACLCNVRKCYVRGWNHD